LKLISQPIKKLEGTLLVPGSKSHTIRAAAIALLASGISHIKNPLQSGDGASALHAISCLGAKVEQKQNEWIITGNGKKITPITNHIDVGNSGTSLRIMTSIAALQEKKITFDGDESLRTRLMESLLQALETLGAKTSSANGKAPLSVQGIIHGGKTSVSGKTSQFLTSLLLVAPLLQEDTTIIVDHLNEKPYASLTMQWLDEQSITYTQKEMKEFFVKGKQSYKPFNKVIPGDWSSAAFPLGAAAITKSKITVDGIDWNDAQGDKKIVSFLEQMGSSITKAKTSITIEGRDLKGIEMDLNDTPDLLPILAVVGCFAKGKTSLLNVPQARIKETDRISAMCKELRKMGAKIEELDDGMIIHQSQLQGTEVESYSDHRIIMALSCAGLLAKGKTVINDAEYTDVTFPGYVQLMNVLGSNMRSL
jgi:3-phosphoshikimate 1-carboxyvinyltransferase